VIVTVWILQQLLHFDAGFRFSTRNANLAHAREPAAKILGVLTKSTLALEGRGGKQRRLAKPDRSGA